MSGGEYNAPKWSGLPTTADETSRWQLVEIKSGSIISHHDLSSRPCTTLGRAEDMVHIALQHESCSRLHARIAFDRATGTPWLRDMGSTHGTVVNKKKLPPQACGRQESDTGNEKGSRGVVLYPGDILQFGASTRLFCLEGPENFGRGAAKAAAVQKKAEASSFNPNPGFLPERSDHACDTDHGDDREDDLLDLSREQIPTQHLRAFDSIQALRMKRENIQKEADAIRRKGDLTDGQENQLRRNEERLNDLEKLIEEKEVELRNQLGLTSSTEGATSDAPFDDEIEVDDRTRKPKHDDFLCFEDAANEAETEESLLKKKALIDKEIHNVSRDLELAQAEMDKIVARIRIMKEQGDEEAFFLENDAQLSREKYAKLKSRKQSLDKLLLETEALLRIVNPLHSVDKNGNLARSKPATRMPEQNSTSTKNDVAPPTSLKIHLAVEMAGTITNDMAPPTSLKSHLAIETAGTIANDMAPPASLKNHLAVETAGEGDNNFIPPPKRKRLLGPAVMPPPGFEPGPTDQKNRDPVLKSTLSFLSSAGKKPEDNAPQQSSRKGETGSLTDGKVDTWHPPKDQDGSGRSRLNDKFAGRY